MSEELTPPEPKKKKQRVLLPLSKRNAETADIAIRELAAKVYQAMTVIAKQQDTLVMLMDRVAKLETALSLSKMNLTGLGPTISSGDNMPPKRGAETTGVGPTVT